MPALALRRIAANRQRARRHAALLSTRTVRWQIVMPAPKELLIVTENEKVLWYWVEERERIRQRKEAGKKVLTNDPILQTYRFCNVRREDDRVTKWIHANIRRPFANADYLWFMLCVARQINWPDTLSDLMDAGALTPFKPRTFVRVMNERANRGEKLFTGAYIITAGPTKGQPKHEYMADVTLGRLWNARNLFDQYFVKLAHHRSLEVVHELLTDYSGWGNFLAYQAVVDMRFTKLLGSAPDRFGWAAAGPGTMRGLNRLAGRPLDKRIKQEQALDEMRALIQRNKTGIDFDFSDMPNILCETDKYLRVKNKEGKPRALYIPGRGS